MILRHSDSIRNNDLYLFLIPDLYLLIYFNYLFYFILLYLLLLLLFLNDKIDHF